MKLQKIKIWSKADAITKLFNFAAKLNILILNTRDNAL